MNNAKAELVTVEALESMIGAWRILSEFQPHTRRSDRQALWQVKVSASDGAALRYRVRSKFRWVPACPKGKSIALVARQGRLFGNFDFRRLAVDQGV